jgi:hypothetical protein
MPAGRGHHDLCPQARGWVTVHGQRDPHLPTMACLSVHCPLRDIDVPGPSHPRSGMKLPGPYMLLVIHMCSLASLFSAYAPLFGNDPFTEGVLGLWVGFLTGLPFYIAAIMRRSRR